MNPLRVVVAATAAVLLSPSGAARTLGVGADVQLTAPQSWAESTAKPKMGFPTIAVKPTDGRAAELLITRFPPTPQIADLAGLREMFQAGTTPMRPPGSAAVPTPFTTVDGQGYWASFEDPDLKGRPIQQGNYKFATALFVRLNNGAILQATLLTNTTDSSEFTEGLAIIKSATVAPAALRPKQDPTKPFVFRAPGRPGAVRLPAGYVETPTSRVRSPNYFMVTGNGGVNISGWIDDAKKYRGFNDFWKHEKQSLVDHGMPPQTERATRIGDWDAVVYIIDAGEGLKIKNLRACRIAGKVWVDTHISIPRPDATWKDLRRRCGA